MKNKLDIKLLTKSDKGTQLLIKAEAESNLKDIHKSEDLMTGKINAFISFSFAIFIIVVGYSMKAITDNNIDLFFILSVSLSVVFSFIIIVLFNALFPYENRALGSEPIELVQEDMIKGDKFDELRILGNRILSMHDDIKTSTKSYRFRLNSYKNAYKILLIGILFTLLIFITFLLCRYSC